MESLCSWLIRQFVCRLWWDELPESIDRLGLLATTCRFVGRVTLLGAVLGGGIGLLLGKRDDGLIECAANGICGLGGLALFIVIATLYLDPDRTL
jgi:hypothetical protein